MNPFSITHLGSYKHRLQYGRGAVRMYITMLKPSRAQVLAYRNHGVNQHPPSDQNSAVVPDKEESNTGHVASEQSELVDPSVASNANEHSRVHQPQSINNSQGLPEQRDGERNRKETKSRGQKGKRKKATKSKDHVEADSIIASDDGQPLSSDQSSIFVDNILDRPSKLQVEAADEVLESRIDTPDQLLKHQDDAKDQNGNTGQHLKPLDEARQSQYEQRLQQFKEAYRTLFGKEPPSRALNNAWMRSRIAECKPDTIIKQMSALVAHFGVETAACILRTQPTLLSLDTAKLQSRFYDVCHLHGWSEEEGTRTLRKYAGTVALTLEYQRKWIIQLAAQLGRSPGDVSRMVLKAPNLLGFTPNNIATKISLLEKLLQVSRADICNMVVRYPQCLMLSEESLTLHVSFLSSAWCGVQDMIRASRAGTPHLPAALVSIASWEPEPGSKVPDAVSKMLVAYPPLLNLSRENLEQKLGVLMSACQSEAVWMASLATMSPGTFGRCLKCSVKRFSRLRYLQSTQSAVESNLSSLLMMQDVDFQSQYPDFEEWWQKDQEKE